MLLCFVVASGRRLEDAGILLAGLPVALAGGERLFSDYGYGLRSFYFLASGDLDFQGAGQCSLTWF